MSTIPFSEADGAAVRYGRFYSPDPRGQVRLEALYWRRQGGAHCEIRRLWGSSKARVPRYLAAYAPGGMEELKRLEPYRPPRAVPPHRSRLEAVFPPPPPATVAEAAARLKALSGSAGKPRPGRQCLRSV